MSQYIKINNDNTVIFLGNKLFDENQKFDVFYTGDIPNGDFFIWDKASNSILEDCDTRREKELGYIRDARNQLLKDTDWIIVKSLESGEIDPEWIEYRQELRDLPSQYSLTGLIDFPNPPISGLHDSINVRELQPHTAQIIDYDSKTNQSGKEDWGDWEGLEQEVEETISGSGVFLDKYDLIPSGVTEDLMPEFLKMSIWNEHLQQWISKPMRYEIEN